jgi:RNA polymerase sigma-70 factor (ECF subfamily)
MTKPPEDDDTWLPRFHAGVRDVMEACYRDHFRTVEQAVGRILHGADKETVVHEVFLQLLSSADLRRRYAGGYFRAWLATVARNLAIDYWRRYRNERGPDDDTPGPAAADAAAGAQESATRIERSAEAHIFFERFRRDVLPLKWVGVFEMRVLGGLDQRTAAARLGIGRTTLAYREGKVRRLLKRFVRERRSK